MLQKNESRVKIKKIMNGVGLERARHKILKPVEAFFFV